MELKIKTFEELSASEIYEILYLRVEVFMLEQNIICQDCDGTDYNALHVFYEENGKVQAYLRVMDKGVVHPDCSIGRVVTLHHGKGLGTKIMLEGIREARVRYGASRIRIDAQIQAKPFYEKLGFVQTSEEYLEEGIWHSEMYLYI